MISPHPRTPTSVAPSQATSRSHSRAAAGSSNSALLLPQSLLAHRHDLQYPHRLSPGTNELLAQPTIFVYSRDRERTARRPPPPAPPRCAHTPCTSSGCSPQRSARQPARGARSTGAHCLRSTHPRTPPRPPPRACSSTRRTPRRSRRCCTGEARGRGRRVAAARWSSQEPITAPK